MYVYLYTCTYVYMCICIYVYVYLCIEEGAEAANTEGPKTGKAGKKRKKDEEPDAAQGQGKSRLEYLR